MKRFASLLSAAALMAGFALTGCNNAATPAATDAQVDTTAAAGSIVFFNIDKVVENYDMANDLRSVVETKVSGIQAEIDRRGNKLQKDANDFQNKMDKGLLTSSVANAQYQKLQQQQANFNNYAAQKQQEMAEEQQVMMNQIADAIKTFIDQFNEEHKYAMIIATQGGILPAPVSCGDPDLDITDALLAGLNSEYVKNKGKDTTTPAASTDTKAE